MQRPIATRALGFFRGLAYPLKGARHVYLQHPNLVRYWIWPVMIMMTVVGGVLGAGWALRETLLDLIWPDPVGEGFWTELLHVLHAVVGLLVAVLLWVVGLVVSLAFASIIAAPFNDLLSEAVEKIVAGNEGPPFSVAELVRGALRSLLLESAKLALFVLVMGPLFVASFAIPVAGQAIYTVVGFFFAAFYFGIDYVDWPASRRGHGTRWRFRFAMRNLMPMLGFGVGVWVLLFVPVLNLLLMPAAVAGGTQLFLDLAAAEEGLARVPSDASAAPHPDAR